MRDLADLIARVEGASGPDRELDADLHLAFGQAPNEHYNRPWRHPILLSEEHRRPGLLEYVEISGVSARPAPIYTASIDAALALMERCLPGLVLVMRRLANGLWQVDEAWIYNGPHDATDFDVDSSPRPGALAILLALLRALQSQEPSDG